MNYTLIPTLEHMTCVKIASKLWSNDNVRNFLPGQFLNPPSMEEIMDTEDDFYFPTIGYDPFNKDDSPLPEIPFDSLDERIQELKKIESKVAEKVLSLKLSKILKEKVLSFINPIGMEILKWIEKHVRNNYFSLEMKIDDFNWTSQGPTSKRTPLQVPDEFYWTSQGTIDNKKMAMALIKDEEIDITKRYKLACIYCLENDIKMFLYKIPKQHIMFFPDCREDCFDEYEIEDFWTVYASGGTYSMDYDPIHEVQSGKYTLFEYAFKCAAESGFKVATEYFFQKLTPEEKRKSLVSTTLSVLERLGDERDENNSKDFSGVVCFLLSQMDSEEQVEVFEKNCCDVLDCFLEWPWQDLFLKNLNYLWHFLREDDYEDILYIIIEKIKLGYKDYDYKTFLTKVLQNIRKTNKGYFQYIRGHAHLLCPYTLLQDFLQIRDRKNILFMLKDATLQEKSEIIFCDEGRRICEELASANEYDLLKFFIVDCIMLSQEKLKQFREEIEMDLQKYRYKDRKNYVCLFKLLDDLTNKGQEKKD